MTDEDPRMRLGVADLEPTGGDAWRARQAVLAERRRRWAARVAAAEARGENPRLMDMDDLAREAAGVAPNPVPLPPLADRPRPVTRGVAKAQGYTGDLCPACGGLRMRRNGTCLLCEACGETTGCS